MSQRPTSSCASARLRTNCGPTTRSSPGWFPSRLHKALTPRARARAVSKYNLITFIPFSLLDQFAYFSNFYFLVIFVIAQIGGSTNLYSTPIDPQGFLLSLAIVIGIAMLFEGWYDLGRHGEDRRFNRAKTRVITTQGHEVEATWESLVAGDVVVVEREGLFPADLLMLAAVCNPKAAVDAEFDWQTCYVETSNIDGETNLKQRKAPARFIAPPADGNWHRALAPWQASYEAPRAALDFSGTLQNVSDPHASHASVPIEFNNLLLRGSRLVEPPWGEDAWERALNSEIAGTGHMFDPWHEAAPLILEFAAGAS